MDKQEFQQHPLWDEIRARITYWGEDETTIGQPLRDARMRAVAVGRYVLALKIAGETVPALFSPSMLENARTQWSQATVNYDSDPHYANMQQSLDALLDVIARWPASKSATSNARSVTEILAGAATDANDAVAFHKKARAEAEDALAGARRISENFAGTVAKIEATLQQQKERAGELTTDRQKEHLDELTAMKATFEEWLDDRQGSYKAMSARRDQEQQDFIRRAEENLATIEKLREDVGFIVGATTSEQMSKSYSDEARREFNLAAWSYGIGVALLAGLAFFLIHTMSDLGPTAEATWQYMSLKVGVSAALVTAATVAFTLGHKFLDSSRLHKRMSMELVVMIPFLADLDEDEAGSLREAKLAYFDRSFGQHSEPSHQNGSGSQDGLAGVVAELGKAVADLSKRNGAT